MKWPTFLGMMFITGFRYLLVGGLVLALGYVGVEWWLWVKQSPPAPVKAVEKPVEKVVEPLPTYRTDKHESELVFYRMKEKIKVLEAEVKRQHDLLVAATGGTHE